jgi:glyoxylase-like metal-dependent hydrolase (beta-lactamase superfamily II)
VHVRHYNTVFHVGERGVLVMDALDGCHSEVADAITSVTDKPVTAVVYPHYHADHVADMPLYLDRAERLGVPLRVIATEKTVAKMAAVGSVLPAPNEVVPWPTGSFDFEGTEVRVHGFEWAAHCDDHSVWLIGEEGVAHAPDLIFPDQPPFWKFGGNDRFLFYERNLRETAELDWTHLSGGHGNVGYREDIDFQLAFIADLEAAVAQAFREVSFDQFIDVSKGNHAAWLDDFMKEVGSYAREQLRGDYGSYYGFEATTPQNAEMVAFTFFAYR